MTIEFEVKADFRRTATSEFLGRCHRVMSDTRRVLAVTQRLADSGEILQASVLWGFQEGANIRGMLCVFTHCSPRLSAAVELFKHAVL